VLPAEVDIDIFTQKKRNLKVNQEEVAGAKTRAAEPVADSNRFSMDSAARLKLDESGSKLLKQKSQTI